MRHKIVLMLMVGSLVACGSASEEMADGAIEAGSPGPADVELDLEDEAQGEVVIETDDLTQRVDLGATEVPESLEVPLPDGYEIIASSDIESGDERIISVVVQYPGGDIESIIAHFDDHFAGDPDAAKNETSIENARQVLWFADDPRVNVVVIERDGEDLVEVSIAQQG